MHQRARTRKFLQPLGKGERVVWCPAPRGGGAGGGGPDTGGERTSGRREVMFGLVFLSI